MPPLISVIIPAYQAENHLQYCLDSLVWQKGIDLAKDVEAIIVDDGSTDQTQAIAQSYCARHPYLHYYYKENGGLSDARNFGLQYATGDFVFFLDADDYLSVHVLASLLKIQKETQADIVVCGYIQTSIYQMPEMHAEMDISSVHTVDPEKGLQLAYEGKEITVSAWAKLIARPIAVQELFYKGLLYEDLEITPRYYRHARQIAYTSGIGCFYYQREGSITNSPFTPRHWDFFKSADLNLAFIQKHYPQNKNLRRALLQNIATYSFHYFAKKFIREDLKKEWLTLSRLYRQKYAACLFCHNLSLKERLRYFLIAYTPRTFWAYAKKTGKYR